MKFRTEIDIPAPPFRIEPLERMLFVGSCFADSIGTRFREEKFRAVVNPCGVMYNPVSISHTVERFIAEDAAAPGAEHRHISTAVFTLGTNHVYRLKETGEIVDNCQKRPQKLFSEEELSVDQCYEALAGAARLLRSANPAVRIIVTVSPIRYAKYGFHGSQLSKATLLLAADRLVRECPFCHYFPAYEILNDELRDYRFYKEDMLHPSPQAVEYIWQRLSELYLSDAAKLFIQRWRPIKEALGHRPFNPDSEEYKSFVMSTQEKYRALQQEYGFDD